MSKQQTDYWSWGMSELIERIEELEKQLAGSAYTLTGGVTVLPDPDDEVKKIKKLPVDEQKQKYAELVIVHDQAVNRFKAMLGETQSHNAFMEYLEELISKLEKQIHE